MIHYIPNAVPDILAVETATDVCSVAVWSQGDILAERVTTVPRSHAEQLVPMIMTCLEEAGMEATALDAIGVSGGPGSYTGLRIGASTAKGLAYATGIPLYSIPTLKGLAYPLRAIAQPGEILCAALNSRKNEVYLACYGLTEARDLIIKEKTHALHHSEINDIFEGFRGVRCWATGEAADTLVKHITPNLEVTLVPAEKRAPDAQHIAALVEEKIKKGEAPVDIMSYEPAYLKPFVAKKPARSKFDQLPF